MAHCHGQTNHTEQAYTYVTVQTRYQGNHRCNCTGTAEGNTASPQQAPPHHPRAFPNPSPALPPVAGARSCEGTHRHDLRSDAASAPPGHQPRAHGLVPGRRRGHRRADRHAGLPALAEPPLRVGAALAVRQPAVGGAARPLGLLQAGLPLRRHLPPAPQPRLLPRQLRRRGGLRARRLAPGAPLLAPHPPWPPRHLVRPLPLPLPRPARRALRPHLLRPRDASGPRRRVLRPALLHLRRVTHHIRAARRRGPRRGARRLPRTRRSLPRRAQHGPRQQRRPWIAVLPRGTGIWGLRHRAARSDLLG